MISPHPPRLRMKRRKTVSVTPAMGASTVAGEIVTVPMERLSGTSFRGAAWRAGVPAPHESAPSRPCELSQNFFTSLFYLAVQNQSPRRPARAEFLRVIRVSPLKSVAKNLVLRRFDGLSRRILGVLAAEALHAAGGIHELLLAGKEGMAGRADFNADVALMGGPGNKRIAARAMHAHFVISGMNGRLHIASDLGTNP